MRGPTLVLRRASPISATNSLLALERVDVRASLPGASGAASPAPFRLTRVQAGADTAGSSGGVSRIDAAYATSVAGGGASVTVSLNPPLLNARIASTRRETGGALPRAAGSGGAVTAGHSPRDLGAFTTFQAADVGGPSRTKENGALPMRCLPSFAAAEEFFFKTSMQASDGGALPTQDGAADEEGSGGRGRARRAENRESLVCRLCNEDISMIASSYGMTVSSDPSAPGSPAGGSGGGGGIISPRVHIAASSRASHTNHSCREVVLDSLALLCRRGYPIDAIMSIWSHTLHRQRSSPSFAATFERLGQFSSPDWSLDKRMDVLGTLLLALKNMGVIDISLAVADSQPGDIALSATPSAGSVSAHFASTLQQRRRVAFERLEYIGDNSWGSNISNRMMLLFPDRQWLYSQSAYSFNCFRDAIEMNVNLEFMYDRLHLERLLNAAVRERIGAGKVKADIVEAIIGELQTYVWGYEPQLYDSASYVEVNGHGQMPLLMVIHHCLTEIYDLIVLSYVEELSHSAIPLAKEIAALHIWRTALPRISRQKDRLGAIRRMRSASVALASTALPATPSATGGEAATDDTAEGFASTTPTVPAAGSAPVTTTYLMRDATVKLPARLLLHTTQVPYPKNIPNPLRASTRSIDGATICSHTRRDVFEDFLESYRVFGLLSDDSSQVFHRVDQSSIKWATLAQGLGVAIYASCREQIGVAAASASQLGPDSPITDSSDMQGERGGVTVAALESADLAGVNESTAILGHDVTMPHMLSIMAPEELYFRDPRYDLMPTPQGSRTLPSLSAGDHLALARRCAYPGIRDSPSDPFAAGGFGPGGAVMRGERSCTFALSQYVPANVKPPSAGVITDKNLHFGLFAMLPEQLLCVARASSTNVAENIEKSDQVAEVSDKPEETAAPDALRLTGLDDQQMATHLKAVSNMVGAWVTAENPYFPARPTSFVHRGGDAGPAAT